MKLFPSSYNYSHRINSRYTLINNTLTGALDIIENNIWNLVEDKKFNSINADPLSNLIERGYLYYDLEKEDKILVTLYDNYTKKVSSRPLRFVFCPSYQCNLRCTYCFQTDLPSNPNKFMSIKILDDAINAAEEISKEKSGKVDSVELFGGEPLLLRNKPLLKKIFKFAKEKDAPITIITNGVMAKDFTDILLPVKEKIKMLQITVDGPPEIHDKRRKYPSGKGSFNEISKSIDLLLKNNINTNVRVNIDNTNIEYLPDLYKYISKKNWIKNPDFNIMLALVTDHSTMDYNNIIIPEEKLLERLIKVYDKYPALEDTFGFYKFKPLRHILDIVSGAPNVSPKFINCESNLLELNIFCPDGYIYACGESIGKPDYAIGKFSPELEFYPDKEKLWTGRTILNIEKCRTCKFAPLCGGGCAYSSILIYKDNSKPICERYQEVLDTFLRLRGEKILKKYVNSF
ncbi:GTP 3',8-cyclase [subsurface metagenome]|nr:4Fe-4S cluster-binding domain-containing protein [Clostridia bacterium]